MSVKAFIKDYFDVDVEMSELAEELEAQLVGESIFPGSVDSIDDSEITDIKVKDIDWDVDDEELHIGVDYVVKMTSSDVTMHIDKETNECGSLDSSFKVVAEFEFAKIDSEYKSSAKTVEYKGDIYELQDVSLTNKITVKNTNYTSDEENHNDEDDDIIWGDGPDDV